MIKCIALKKFVYNKKIYYINDILFTNEKDFKIMSLIGSVKLAEEEKKESFIDKIKTTVVKEEKVVKKSKKIKKGNINEDAEKAE